MQVEATRQNHPGRSRLLKYHIKKLSSGKAPFLLHLQYYITYFMLLTWALADGKNAMDRIFRDKFLQIL